jgi:hypothetical protein
LGKVAQAPPASRNVILATTTGAESLRQRHGDFALLGILSVLRSPWPLSRAFHNRGYGNTGLGLPPVIVGLFASMFLWRSGPLGFLASRQILLADFQRLVRETRITTAFVTHDATRLSLLPIRSGF